MIQSYLRSFLTDVVTKWNAGQKMTLFMVLMSFEIMNYLVWMAYIKHSDYAQQFVNINIINSLLPWAIGTVVIILCCAYLFYHFQKHTKFIHGFQLFVMIVYTLAAAYIGYLVGQENIMSAIAVSTAGLLIVLFCERKFSYWIVGLNLLCMFSVMYASKTGVFPPSQFYIGTRNTAFWVFSYMSLCGLKLLIILLFADNMLYVLKQSYQESKFLSEHDALTGIPNRINTQKYLFNSIQTHHHVGLIMIDLDHFKQINDNFGHLFGDTVLIEVTKVMQANLREFDVLGRYGGEEFILVMPEANMPTAKKIAHRLHELFNQLEIPIDNKKTLKPKASFGVVTTDFVIKNTPNMRNEEIHKRLFQLADASMYLAKQRGRNRVVSADELPEALLESTQDYLMNQQAKPTNLTITNSKA